MKIDPFQRFLDVQDPVYSEVLAELSSGKKSSHWMWFIFPQHVALGTSDRAKRYGLYGVEQAREYLEHPVLGKRLLQCCELLETHSDKSAAEILGDIDALKFRSCLTLFRKAAPSEPIFGELLELFYQGEQDPRTLDLIQSTCTRCVWDRTHVSLRCCFYDFFWGNVFKHLLVPVDEYSVEDDDFASLRTLALADDARVTLVHISDPLPPTFYLQNGYGGDYITVADHKKACTSYAHRLFKRAEQKIGTLVRTDTLHLFNADVAAGIVDAVKTAGADGILMVSHKRSGLAGLVMGSETRDVMRKASVPLLVL